MWQLNQPSSVRSTRIFFAFVYRLHQYPVPDIRWCCLHPQSICPGYVSYNTDSSVDCQIYPSYYSRVFNKQHAVPSGTPVMQSRTGSERPKTLDIKRPFPQSIFWHFHRIVQQPRPSPFSKVNRAALVAASKTSSTPSPVKEEHSRYLRAPISRATLFPSLSVVKCCDFFLISSWAIWSSRRSFFRPTRMIGTPGHLSLASSTHFADCQI